jgi:hypothetical protein
MQKPIGGKPMQAICPIDHEKIISKDVQSQRKNRRIPSNSTLLAYKRSKLETIFILKNFSAFFRQYLTENFIFSYFKLKPVFLAHTLI